MDNPKLFISYSWSSPEHESWVLELATSLRENSVDVILDKWDLKEGQDSIKFMEQMVNDENIKKVIMICDKTYMEKSNNRKGGAGVEAQIISPELYAGVDQTKFVAVIKEKDENGKAFVPIYYKGRIYIDLSDETTYAGEFEKLLRWIYDKPAYIKPQLGKKPSFLDEKGIALGTTNKQKRVIDNLVNAKGNVQGAIKDYFDEIYEKFESFRLDFSNENDPIKIIMASLDLFTSYRDEILSVITYISKYDKKNEYKELLHNFFESLLYYLCMPDDTSQWYTAESENYAYMIYELFIYTIAIFLKDENFDYISYLLNAKYFIKKPCDLFGPDTLLSFCAFRPECKSIYRLNEYKNAISQRSALLRDRNKNSNIKFYYLMEADFTCFLKAEMLNERWPPDTLIYMDFPHRAFEIFAKSISPEYFNKIKDIFGFNDVEKIAKLLLEFKNNVRKVPYWNGRGFDPYTLIGFEKLALANIKKGDT